MLGYTNEDLCRIPGHATQAKAGLSGTWAEADRPKPRCTWQIQLMQIHVYLLILQDFQRLFIRWCDIDNVQRYCSFVRSNVSPSRKGYNNGCYGWSTYWLMLSISVRQNLYELIKCIPRNTICPVWHAHVLLYFVSFWSYRSSYWPHVTLWSLPCWFMCKFA